MSFIFDFLFVAFTDTFVGLMLAILTVPINILTELILGAVQPA